MASTFAQVVTFWTAAPQSTERALVAPSTRMARAATTRTPVSVSGKSAST